MTARLHESPACAGPVFKCVPANDGLDLKTDSPIISVTMQADTTPVLIVAVMRSDQARNALYRVNIP